MLSLVRSPSISDSRIQTFQKIITSKASIIMDHTTVLQKGLEHQICQKTKRKRKSISDRHPIIVQHLQEAYPLSRASANVLTCCWTACWTVVRCRPEKLFLSLSFCLLTEPVLRPLLYRCRMAHGDGGVWCNVFWKVVCLQESEKDDNRTMNVSIKTFNRLTWFMMPNVKFKTLPTFLHHRFWAWYVSPCHGRNL